MARRIRKQKPKAHLVVPDTSAIWHEDKQHAVDPAFDAFWDAYVYDCSLELHIPEVVRGELLFQQTSSAVKSLGRANQAIADIQRVTQRTYSHRITPDRVRQEVERKFDQWVASRHAAIVPTPTNVIVWPEVIRQAIWHEPPFECQAKGAETEKGFRDALILETLVHICAKETRDLSVAFLCKDDLLRQTAERRLSTDKRVSVYVAIDDFKTYLDLTKEKLEDAFIKALVRRASEKFFSKGDSECLYFRDSLRGVLKEKYKRHFENPEESEPRGIGLLRPRSLKAWEAMGSGTFWISPARFVRKDEESQYVWESSVTFVQQFKTPEGGASSEPPEQKNDLRVLVLPFVITWRARVTTDGRFWEYSFLNDELRQPAFRKRTDEDVKEWNLEG